MTTQTERVLNALQRYPRGITQVDFLLPDVIDGGPPITRIGARILELRDAGHKITSGPRRDKCVTYKLESLGDRETANGGASQSLPGRASDAAPAGPTEAAPLFEVPAQQPTFEDLVGPQCAINDDLPDAA